MARANLGSMSVEALLKLRDDVGKVLSQKATQLEEQLSRLGGEVGTGGWGRGSAMKGRKVPVKYRDKEGNTWAGRGAQPVWLREKLKAGASKTFPLKQRRLARPPLEKPKSAEARSDEGRPIGSTIEGASFSDGPIRRPSWAPRPASGRSGSCRLLLDVATLTVGGYCASSWSARHGARDGLIQIPCRRDRKPSARRKSQRSWRSLRSDQTASSQWARVRVSHQECRRGTRARRRGKRAD
jgi:H-NS histone family